MVLAPAAGAVPPEIGSESFTFGSLDCFSAKPFCCKLHVGHDFVALDVLKFYS